MSASAVKVGTVTPVSTEKVLALSGCLLEKDGALFSVGVVLHLTLWSSFSLGTSAVRSELENPHISQEGFAELPFLPRLQEAAEVVNGIVQKQRCRYLLGESRRRCNLAPPSFGKACCTWAQAISMNWREEKLNSRAGRALTEDKRTAMMVFGLARECGSVFSVVVLFATVTFDDSGSGENDLDKLRVERQIALLVDSHREHYRKRINFR